VVSELKNGFFNYKLSLKLILEADGKTSELLAGVIDNVFLDLHSYGFNGNIRFTGYDNPDLNTLFHSKKPIKITLTISPTDPSKQGPPLLELKGIVTERRWKRVDEANHAKKLPIYHYLINIADHAQVTWGEHFPVNIYVSKSMKEVFEEHKNPEITIKYDFPPLEAKHPITAFSLCYNKHLSRPRQISFYSFFNWYMHQEGGILSYIYKNNTYSVIAKKAEGKPFKISEWLISPVSGLVPSESRYDDKTIKHSPTAMDAEDKTNDHSFKSVRRDSIDPAKYRTFPEHTYEKVESPLDPTQPEMELFPLHFENDFHLDKLIPGSFISFTSDENSWTQDPLIKDKEFRCRSMIFSADRTESLDTHKNIQVYRIAVKSILEPKEETYIDRPYFSPPIFPFEIEGEIFSDIGDKPQSTFKISEDDKAPQGQYLVKVPLAGKDLKVVVPFTPNLSSGQQYFPYFKEEKVLLGMYFRTALIKRVIDWNKLTRLPNGVQGVQTVFSSNGKDEYSILKHEFEDGKNSVVTLKQSTSAVQTQTLTIKDKEILIQVVEKDKKTVLMRYHSEEGITISFAKEEEKSLQELKMDGKQITHTCKDSSDTSTFVQTPKSFSFTAKDFNIISDKVTADIKDVINHKAGSKINLESPVINAKGDLKVGG
jgi:hypothetical protein